MVREHTPVEVHTHIYTGNELHEFAGTPIVFLR
jgi:hypothetical protein